MKAYIKNIFLLFLLFGFIYSIICIILTHNVMVKTKQIIQGKEIVLDMENPLYKISFNKQYFPEVKSIQGKVLRIFTWCGRKRGCIYILYWKKYMDETGNVIYEAEWSDAKLIIDKVNNRWEIVDICETP